MATVLIARTPVPLGGTLSEVGLGQGPNSEPDFCWVANFLLSFQTPSALDPQNLVITVQSAGVSIVLPNQSRVEVVTLEYHPNSIPHWLINLGGSVTWSGFAVTALNPDGTEVGGATPAEIGQTATMYSPVFLSLDLPPNSDPHGHSIVIHSTANPGTIESGPT